MSKAYKGGEFEREISKKLSKWWTKGLEGVERDDVFWRSSQSGGRATQRAKSGKDTYGSHADLTAVDPIGAPLLKLFTIELKRGSSHGNPGDLLDASPTNAVRPIESCLLQAYRSHISADSQGWMLLCRRDHRVAVAYIDSRIEKLLKDISLEWKKGSSIIKYDILVNQPKPKERKRLRFVGVPLEHFLSKVSPQQIIECLKVCQRI